MVPGSCAREDQSVSSHRDAEAPQNVLAIRACVSFSTIPCRSEVLMAKRSKFSAAFDAKSFLARLDDGRNLKKYPAGEIVFTQGDPADAVFYIKEGKTKITVVSEQGKEAVVAFLEPEQFFGEGCLAGQSRRITTAIAITDSLFFRIEKSVIIKIIHDDPAFAEIFIAHLLKRTSRIEADLIDQLFNSSEKRLARALLLLANFGKDSDPEPVLGKISQETLAQMIGTTRARVNHFMNKFRRLGFISYNGRIEVHSSLLNMILHDQPDIEK